MKYLPIDSASVNYLVFLPKSYARARLFTGIAGVGLAVSIAIVALFFGWPLTLLPNASATLFESIKGLLAMLAVFALAQAPLDFLGGHFFPRAYARSKVSLPQWLLSWVRGLLVYLIVSVTCLALLLLAGRSIGTGFALILFVGLVFALIAFQQPLASLVARLRPVPSSLAWDEGVACAGAGAGSSRPDSAPRILEVESSDPGFTGGVSGLPGSEVIILPAHWRTHLNPDELSAVLQRRSIAVSSRSRTRGVAVAIVFNVCGLSLCAMMKGAGFTSAAALGTLLCWFVVWSFLGLLTLPTLSRRASHWLDHATREAGVSEGSLQGAIEHLDRLQDDDCERPRAIETIFYPTPSVVRRADTDHKSVGGRVPAWHVARMALYVSWGCGNPLARAVHCNAGRTQLWVMLPTD